MKKQTCLRMLSIFIGVLIVSLPFYVSDVYAQSLNIVKNSGQDEVEGYLRKKNDIWTLQVEASVPSESVSPEQLILNNDPRFDFDTCVSTLGGYLCTYTYDYSGGDLGVERAYPMEVDLYDSLGVEVLETETTTTVVDGSAPEITALNIVQSGEAEAQVSMIVEERPDNCVGLDRVEVYDADENVLLRSVSFTSSMVEFKCGQNEIDLAATFPAGGSTTKTGKVVVYDKLGHSSTASDVLRYDYEEPVIRQGTLKLGDFGDYIPSGSASLNVSIEIVEDGDFLDVMGSSSAWGWLDEEAVCEKTNLSANIFTCVWENIDVQMSESVNLQLEVTDGANEVSETVFKTYTFDATAPLIEFFGTKDFDGTIYANPGSNTIRAVFDEGESGMEADSVRANLGDLDPNKAFSFPADYCSEASGTWTCVWEDVRNKRDYSPANIYLTQAEDRAGNEATGEPSANLVLDSEGPEITDIDVGAIGLEGLVGFFKSNDRLQINIVAEDEHGIEAWVDLSDVVNSFPPGFEHENKVVEAQCDLVNNTNSTYECVAFTPRIKSGHDPSADIEVIVKDFAGNEVTEDYPIEIQALEQELNPDYWFVDDISSSPSAIDIDTVKLIPQNMFYAVSLKTTVPNVEVNGIAIDDCEGDVDKLEVPFVVNSVPGVETPYVVLQLKPFTDTVEKLNFNCTINVYTRRGTKAITVPEKESLELNVSFYKSQLGAEFDALAEKIETSKDRAETGFFGTIGAVKDILKVAQMLCQGLYLLDKLRMIYELLTGKSDAMRETQYGRPAAISLCTTNEVAEDKFYQEDVVQPLKIFCDFATCQHDYGVDQWSQWAQPYKAVGIEIDPYSSIVASLYKLCLPGLVYNLEKLRQIECRYIYCMETEVQTGLTTLDGCRQLKEYQTCKYIYTELFWLLNPFQPILDQLFDTLKSQLTDPVGMFEIFVQIPCYLNCMTSGSWTVLCDIAGWTQYVLDITNDVIVIAEGVRSIKKDYCNEVDVDVIEAV